MADQPIVSDPTLFGEQPQVQPVLFEKPVNPAVPPMNAAELAAQLAVVDEKQLEMPFTNRLVRKTQDLNTQGSHAMISDVAMMERRDNLQAMRAHAEVVAKSGDAPGLQQAALMIKNAQDRLGDMPDAVEGNKAVANRSLEMLGLQYAANRYKSLEAFDEVLKREGDVLSLRNLVGQKTAEINPSTWDHISHFFSVLLPFAHDYRVNRAISGVTGTDRYFDTEAAVNDFRQFFMGLAPTERLEVITQLAKQEMGVFGGENKAASVELLRKLSDLTKGDAELDFVFNSLAAFDVATIGKGLATLVRRGTPLRVIKETAGEKIAGELAAADLVNGTQMGGLNQAELMAKALSMGKNPMDIDPAAFAGLSASVQTTLRQSWDNLLETTRNRLISSGLTPEEIKAGLADIKAKYSVNTNQTVHSVVFGEGDELGQKMTVYWQGPDGKTFGSREAADAWAKAEGKAAYEVVPKNMSDATFHAAEDVTTRGSFPTDLRGNVLVHLKNKPEEIDGLFQVLGRYEQDPLALQLLDQWKAAAQAGRSAMSAERILKTIASQSSDPDYRFLAEHLLGTNTKGIRWDKLPVELHTELKGKGTYVVSQDKVRVLLNHASDPETLLHELIHAHNSQVITLVAGSKKLSNLALTHGQIEAAQTVIDLHKRIKSWANGALLREAEKHGGLADELGNLTRNTKFQHALSHPAELITYGLTNPYARDVLKKLKLSDLGYTGESASVFSKFWEAFKGLLGLRADDTALAKLMDAHGKLQESIGEGARQSLTNMKKVGALSEQDIIAMMNAGKKGEFAAKGGKKKGAPKAPPAPTEEWLVKEQRQDPISFGNIGKFSEEDIRSMPWIAVDPKHGASELAMEERVIGVHAEAKTRHDLTSFLAPFFSKLDKNGKLRVKAMLEEGDAVSNAGGTVGKEFAYPELRARGLSENEAQAYFAARQVRMVSYHLRNGEMVRALRAEGMKEIEFVATGEKYAGKMLEQDQAGQVLGKVAYDTITGAPYLVDSATLENSYRAGKKIVQLKQPIEMKGKLYYNVLVDDTTAKAREIQTALHYRPGEFSRIYTDQYFITVKKMAEVDGKVQELTETVRTAASSREATEYVEGHRKAIQLLLDNSTGKSVPRNLEAELEKLIGRWDNAAELKARFDNGELSGYTGMDFHYTRNKEEYLNSSVSEAATSGRLFTSKRSEKLFSVDRDRVNTMDVFDSLSAEITNISRVANISMWRESMIRRWMNTFGDMLPNRTGNDVGDFFAAADAKFTKGTADAQFAERTHRYIMRQLGVKTDEEKFYEGVTRLLTEKLFTGNERIESVGAYVRQKGWLGFVRNINFNFNLGMFNPAQLIVQANGAATAMILSPLHGAKAAMTFPLLRMALMSDNPEVWRNLARIEKFKNLGLSDEREFIELVKGIRKAGILDNLKSTSLWNLEDGALDIFAGYPKKALDSHTFFFNRGEEFSRVVSFDVGRREWMAKNPGMAWNTDEALKQIVVRMDDLTQNMTKANLARFQTGALSIPFQFAQYNIKLAANVMTAFASGGRGRGFSRMEAAQLLLGHVLLYGAAGNGLVALTDEVLGNSIKDKLPVKAKELLSQGLVAWAFDNVAEHLTGEGAKVAVGSRLGSFNYYQQIAEAAFSDKTTVYSTLLGPTVSTAKRADAITEVVKLWWKDPELTGQDILEGLSKMGVEQVATLRNASKAYLYMQHQGKMLDRQGVPLGRMNKNELLAQALGFQPTVAVDLNAMIKSKQDHGKALDDIAKLIMRVQKDIVTDLNSGNTARAEEQKKLLQALWPDNSGDMFDVQRRIRDRLFPYDTEMQKLLGEYVWKGQTYNKPVIVTEEPKKAP